MQRWKEEFVPNTHRKCVHVHLNGNFEQGKVLYMEPDWSYLDFLNAASQRLNMVPAAKRGFNADGVEIDDCMMIEDNDILFLSNIDDFIPPVDLSPDEGLGGGVEGEKIPHTIGGFKVGELLGRGGFGEVRVGEHHLTGERVALKFLRKSEIHSLFAAERTNTEIQCLQALKHNNIIRLQQHLETTHHVVLVFELMEGGDLLKFLVQRKAAGQAKASLSEEEARHVFYQVVSAVSYAHNQHICHRDLKLENILLKDPSINLVKIADFGLSDFYRPGATMKCSCGTLSFLAPEVFKGTANAGPPLDVWSLGVILFALLCGRLPFEGNDLANNKRPRDAVIKTRILKCQYKLDDALSPEAKDLVRRMLQSDPRERLTLPEIFNHIWLRNTVNGTHYGDVYLYNAANNLIHQQQQPHLSNSNPFGFFSSPVQPTAPDSSSVKALLLPNQHISHLSAAVDLLLTSSSPNSVKQKRSNSDEGSGKGKPSTLGSSKPPSANDLLRIASEKTANDHLVNESVSNTPNHLFPIASNPSSFRGLETNHEQENEQDQDQDNDLVADRHDSKDDTPLHPPLLADETKFTFRLVPLRRSNSSKHSGLKGNGYDDDFLYSSSVNTSQRNSFATSQSMNATSNKAPLHDDHSGSTSSWRPSTTIASGGRRNILSTNTPTEEDSHNHQLLGTSSAVNSRKDLLRASPRLQLHDSTISGSRQETVYDFKSPGNGNGKALLHSVDTSPFLSKPRSLTPTQHHPHSHSTTPVTGLSSHPASANKRKDNSTTHNISAGLASLHPLSPSPNNNNNLDYGLSPVPPPPNQNSPVQSSLKGRHANNNNNNRMRF